MKSCFLFPGQGAQYPGMGRDLWESTPAVRELFRKAGDLVGMDLEKLVFEGSEEDLRATDKTQIAVTVVNLAAAEAAKARGILPDGCAGFSLGEYAALTEAGILAVEDVFPLVKARGLFMEQASRALDSGDGAPGMAAVIGLSHDDLVRAIRERQLPDVFVANYNSPNQIVISGTAAGLSRAETELKEAGARRVIRLKVSGPFHSPLLSAAREQFAARLAEVPFREPRLPVYSNVTGKAIRTGSEARSLCAEQIVSTVRWVDVETAIVNDGFGRVLETGPGSVLCGLWKSIGGDVPCFAAGKRDEIDSIPMEDV